MAKITALLAIVLVFMAACVPPYAPIVETATAAPPTLEPTPTLEGMHWFPGCTINPHCDSDLALTPVNPNADLDAPTALVTQECVETVIDGIPHSRCVTVHHPSPPGLYVWHAKGAAVDGEIEYQDAMPETLEYDDGDMDGYELNISGMRGSYSLQLVNQELYDQRYVIGAEFAPLDLHPYDASLAHDPALMDKWCTLSADNGMSYALLHQQFVLGDNGWTDAPESAAVYVIQLETPHTVSLECGVYSPHGALDGRLVIDRLFISPVGLDYGAGDELNIP